MDERDYIERTAEEEAKHESFCRRCGECCGASGDDPCANLVKLEDGRYGCKAYSNRIGIQYTLSGKMFTCVGIRAVLNAGVRYSKCGYDQR